MKATTVRRSSSPPSLVSRASAAMLSTPSLSSKSSLAAEIWCTISILVTGNDFDRESRQLLGKVNGKADYVRSSLDESLKRLNIDCIDLYYQHRVDTTV